MLRVIVLSLIVGFGVSCVAFVASTVFLHRGLAHKAVTFKRPVTETFRLPGVDHHRDPPTSVGRGAPQAPRLHRRRGRPALPRAARLVQGAAQQRRAVPRARRATRETLGRYARDLQPTRADRWFYDHALFGLAIGIGVLVVVFGPLIGLLAAFVHVNLYLGGSAAVNAIAHHFGRRPYPNRAGNLQWLAFITAGEGLHNNHHAAPTSARLSHRWFEIDPGWWVIRTLMLFRLAKVRLTELHFVSAKRVAA